MSLWQPLGEQELLKALRQSKQFSRQAYNSEVRRAVDYLEGRQRDDIEQELQTRYSKSQSGNTGQQIYPVTMPITQRYVAEAANAYNKPVIRSLVNDAGEEQEEVTKALRDHLDRVGYDEIMHQNEKLTILLGVSCVWYQAKRGMLRPVVTTVDDVYPVAATDALMDDGVAADPKDQNDYAGFIVQLVHAIDDISKIQQNQFALITPAEVIYYKAIDPYEPRMETMERVPNPVRFPQPSANGKLSEQALQMFTVWHSGLPLRSLLGSADAQIVDANRELNIQWSLLFDTIRVQGWSSLLLSVMDPNSAPTSISHGARFPITLKAGETASMMNGSTPYGQIVEVLKTFSKLLAISLRQSPSDFSVDQAAAVSGFSKLVDSLPKIEARQERIRRLTHLEQYVAWPRIAAIMIHLGLLPKEAAGLKLRVRYAAIEYPKTPQEEQIELDTNFKHGLDSPVQVLMRRHGWNKQEAEAFWGENMDTNQANTVGQNPYERAAQLRTDLRYNMTNPIKVIAESNGISEAEATKIFEANQKINAQVIVEGDAKPLETIRQEANQKVVQEQKPDVGMPDARGLMAQLIGRRNAGNKAPGDKQPAA